MKFFIKNRSGKNISVILGKIQNQRGIVFILHGLGGTKDQPHIETVAKTFEKAGFTTIRWDARNTFGESEGKYEDATTTNYLEDMEDVISWSQSQLWFQEPFIIAGHSLGSFCSLIYAERHPEQVRALAPISTVISGKESMRAKEQQFGKEQIAKWKQEGWIDRIGANGKRKRIKWAELEDRLKYDTIADAHKLTMPVLLIIGENDESTPVYMQNILYDSLPGPKELHIIPRAPHTFVEHNQLEIISKLLTAWIEKYQ